MVLVFPSGIFWGCLCVLGIYVFFSDPQGGIRGYPLLTGSENILYFVSTGSLVIAGGMFTMDYFRFKRSAAAKDIFR